MNLKEKSWVWRLTWPFAWGNYTTIGDTLYFPKGDTYVPRSVIAHEEIHARQQQAVGVVKFCLLYLGALPLLWNPWRWKWEFEAYTEGSKYSRQITVQLLKSYRYGWLIG
jgi:hypothetical protein